MTEKFIKICFGLDVSCTNLRVEWIGEQGLLVNCKEKNCIKLQVDPFSKSPNKCLEGVVFCDDCDVCKPIHFKKCFCDTNLDCSDCEFCDQSVGGICTKICTEEEINNGKICTDKGCICPPDKPYTNPITNKCSECIENSIHPDNPCVKCTNGMWKVIDCGDGKCVNGECKDCIDSSDCEKNTDGRTRCLGDNKCGCQEGYYYNFIEKRCKPKEQCNGNEIKDNCFECVKGKFEPILCPDGEICIPGLGCRKKCDCNNPSCDSNAACIYGGEDCFCNECIKNENGECSEGCYKDADGNCKPNECNGKCNNGLDCNGKKCGCNTIEKICEPCDKYSCSECGQILGCKCNGLNKCVKDKSCDKPCVTKYDCDSECTCNKGNCTSCDNLTGKEREDCLNKQCNDDIKLILDKDCTNCDASPCDLKLEINKKECCQCENLTIESHLKMIQSADYVIDGKTLKGKKLNFEVLFKKNGILLSNSDVIKDSEKLSGSVSLRYTVKYSINGSVNSISKQTGNVSLVGDNSIYDLPQIILPNLDSNISEPNYSLRIISTKVVVVLNSDVEFFNDCVYKKQDLSNFLYTVKTYSTLDKKSFLLTSSNCRRPIIEWLRSESINSSTPGYSFKKIYANKSSESGKYFDILHDRCDGLLSGYEYSANVDCTCAIVEPVKALFCESFDGLVYEIIDCGKTLKISHNFIPCDVDQDLSKINCSNEDIPYNDDAQVYWILKINGNVVNGSGWKLDDSGLIGIGNYTDVNGELIKTIEIIHSHNPQCKKIIEPSVSLGYELTSSCNEGGTITFKNTGSVTYTVTIVNKNDPLDTFNVSVQSGNTYKFVMLGQSKTYNVEIVNADCSYSDEISLPDDCCNEQFKITSIENTPDGLSIKINGSNPQSSTTIYVDNIKYPHNKGDITITLESGKTYSIKAININGCSDTKEYSYSCNNGMKINNVTSLNDNLDSLLLVTTPSITNNTVFDVYIDGVKKSHTLGVVPFVHKRNTEYLIKTIDANGCEDTFKFKAPCSDPFIMSGVYDINTSKLTIGGILSGLPDGDITYNGGVVNIGDIIQLNPNDYTSSGSYELNVMDSSDCPGIIKFTVSVSKDDCVNSIPPIDSDVTMYCSKSGANEIFRIDIPLDSNYGTIMDSNCDLKFNGKITINKFDTTSIVIDTTTTGVVGLTTKVESGKTVISLNTDLTSISINSCDIESVSVNGYIHYSNKPSKNCLCTAIQYSNIVNVNYIKTSDYMDLSACCNIPKDPLIDVSWTDTNCVFTFSVLNYKTPEGYNLSVKQVSTGINVYTANNEVVTNPSVGTFTPPSNGDYEVTVTDNKTGDVDVEILTVSCLSGNYLLDTVNSYCETNGDHTIINNLSGGNCIGLCNFVVKIFDKVESDPTKSLIHFENISIPAYDGANINSFNVTIPAADTLSSGNYYVELYNTSLQLLDTSDVPVPVCSVDCDSGNITYDSLTGCSTNPTNGDIRLNIALDELGVWDVGCTLSYHVTNVVVNLISGGNTTPAGYTSYSDSNSSLNVDIRAANACPANDIDSIVLTIDVLDVHDDGSGNCQCSKVFNPALQFTITVPKADIAAQLSSGNCDCLP